MRTPADLLTRTVPIDGRGIRRHPVQIHEAFRRLRQRLAERIRTAAARELVGKAGSDDVKVHTWVAGSDKRTKLEEAVDDDLDEITNKVAAALWRGVAGRPTGSDKCFVAAVLMQLARGTDAHGGGACPT